MEEEGRSAFQLTAAGYTVEYHAPGLPYQYRECRQRATLVEEFDLEAMREGSCIFVAQSGADYPFLVIAHGYSRRFRQELVQPGVLLVPETRLLFAAFHEHVLAYDLASASRLWEAQSEGDFWAWRQHGNIVLLSAELHLAAWDTRGRSLWSTFVEPPWRFAIAGDQIRITVLDFTGSFSIEHGPTWGRYVPWVKR